MKLRKDKWEQKILGEISTIIMGQSPPSSTYNEVGEGLPFFQGKTEFTDKHPIAVKWCTKPKKIAEPNDILITVRAPVGATNIANQKCCIGRGIAAIRSNQNKDFILAYLQSIERELSLKGTGTIFDGISGKILIDLPILLPPLSEQKQIAELFQSIDNAIEQVEGQEKSLKALWKNLIDDLANEKPSFGNLLVGKKLQTVNYCDVTDKIMRKIDPVSYGVKRIVAGENLQSEDFKIRTWGTVGKDCLGPAFHVLFKKGDILYGSRRTYLRKVALADFEGVCANTTYVIRAKEELLLQDYLKHIMLSEKFTQYSIGVSKGSTNPYINWKDLDAFSFKIPDISIQKNIVEILEDLLNIIEQLKQQKTTLQNLKQKLLNEILG